MDAVRRRLARGVLFNVMPCVLPVLPLKAAGFTEPREHHRGKSDRCSGWRSASGSSRVFGVLAVLVLVLRTITWGELFTNPWFVWPLVVLLVVMAVGMFGVFTSTLPTALYAVDPRHDTYRRQLLFGALTAVLSTPCTAPLLPGAAAVGVDAAGVVGVPAMMMVGVGMAFPYLVLSATPGARAASSRAAGRGRSCSSS